MERDADMLRHSYVCSFLAKTSFPNTVFGQQLLHVTVPSPQFLNMDLIRRVPQHETKIAWMHIIESCL